MASQDWSALPVDILSLVTKQLPVIDYVRCGSVCKSWNQAVAGRRFSPAPEPPWLMLTALDYSGSRTFFNLSNDVVSAVRLPELRGYCCIGSSSGGHLILANDQASQLLVMNPLTGARIPLPPIATISSIEATFSFISETRAMERTLNAPHRPLGHWFFRKAVLSDNATNVPPTVAIICSLFGQLAFARAGDETWSLVDTRMRSWNDIIFHRGLLYALHSDGHVLSFDLREHPPPSPTMTLFNPDPDDDDDEMLHVGDCYLDAQDFTFKYLVESTGADLLQVWSTDYLPRPATATDDEDYPTWKYVTTPFIVFKSDRSSNRWFRVTRLDGDALMLSRKCSMCVSTRDFPELRPNCVYFALFARPKLGVFSLEDESIEHRVLVGDNQLSYPLPVWFSPFLS